MSQSRVPCHLLAALFLLGAYAVSPVAAAAALQSCENVTDCKPPSSGNTTSCYEGGCWTCTDINREGVDYPAIVFTDFTCRAVCSRPWTYIGMVQCQTFFPGLETFCYDVNHLGFTGQREYLDDRGNVFPFVGLCAVCPEGLVAEPSGFGCLANKTTTSPLEGACTSYQDCTAQENNSTLCWMEKCKSCPGLDGETAYFDQVPVNETQCVPVCTNPESADGATACSAVYGLSNGGGYCKDVLKLGLMGPTWLSYKSGTVSYRDSSGTNRSFSGVCIPCSPGQKPNQLGTACEDRNKLIPVLPTEKKTSRGWVAGIVTLSLVVVLASITLGFFWKQGSSGEVFDGLKVYSYSELRAATNDFRDVLGDGGSASVYRAEVGGLVVAVKKLKAIADHATSEREFTAEAQNLGRLLHINIVRLLGYSNDSKRPKMLVYEFVDGGALDTLLYSKQVGDGESRTEVSFDRRMQIALGIARGIEYCHHMIDPAIVHRDIKPANILLTSQDEDAVPKVADFGLARLIDPTDKGEDTVLDMEGKELAPVSPIAGQWGDGVSLLSSTSSASSGLGVHTPGSNTTINLPGGEFTYVAGTRGYIDPEYFQTSRATLMSDVYSFGVVLLELVMGQRPMVILATLSEILKDKAPHAESEPSHTYKNWLDKLLQEGEETVASRVISSLGQPNVNSHRCFQALKIACQCIEEKGKLRPPMRQVVRMLEQLDES